MPKLEIIDVILMHCIIVNNSYQKASKFLFTFVPDKQFGQLITIVSDSLTMLKTTKCRIFIYWSMVDRPKQQTTWNLEINMVKI